MQKKKSLLFPAASSLIFTKKLNSVGYSDIRNFNWIRINAIICLFALAFLFPLKSSFAQTKSAINKSVIKGLEYSYNFNWQKAADIFQNLVDRYPGYPQGYHYIASIYMWHYLSNQDKRDYDLFVAYSDTALEKAREILEKNPKNTNILFIIGADYSYRAITFSKAEKFLDAVWASKKSEAYLNSTLEIDSSFYDAYLGLGLLNFAVGQIPGAFRWALSLAGIHGDKELGLNFIKKAAREGYTTKVEAEYYLSQILSDYLLDYGSADKYLKSLVQRYPNNLLFSYSYAVLNIKRRRLDDARKYLLKVLRSDDSSFKQIKSFSSFLMGDIFYKKNMFDSAKGYYKEFLDSTNSDSYTGIANYRLAVCYEITGDRTDAVRHFEAGTKGNMDIEDDIYAKRKCEIYEKRSMDMNELSLIRFSNMVESGRYKIAIDSLSALLERAKTDKLKAEVYLQLSDASYHLGRYKEALNYAVSAKVLNSYDEKWIKPFACYYAAKADKLLGDEKAVKSFVEEAEQYSDYDYQKKLENMLFSLNAEN